MNGRVYDPIAARFVSGDPLVQDPINGQNYNRYSYVLNNPTNLTDPTGFAATKEESGGAPTCQTKGNGCAIVTDNKDWEKSTGEAATSSAGTATSRTKVSGSTSEQSANTNRDNIVRDAMLSSPNPSVAQASACVGHEGACVAGLGGGFGGGWLGSTKIGQLILGLFAFGSEVQNFDGVPTGRGVAGLGAKTAANAGPEMVRVGRWMSQTEYEVMKRTGQLQEGAGGMTSMATSGPASFVMQTARGNVYVEFSIARNSVVQGGRADWLTGVSANAMGSMQAAIRKQGGELSPAVSNISLIQAVKK